MVVELFETKIGSKSKASLMWDKANLMRVNKPSSHLATPVVMRDDVIYLLVYIALVHWPLLFLLLLLLQSYINTESPPFRTGQRGIRTLPPGPLPPCHYPPAITP